MISTIRSVICMNQALGSVWLREAVALRILLRQAVTLPQEDMICRSAWHSFGREEKVLAAVLGDSGEWTVDMML